MLEMVSIDEAARMLAGWWSHPVPPAITPDWAADAARRAGCTVRVDRGHDWEATSDEESLLALTGSAGELSGDVLLISEASFCPGSGAFVFDASRLQDTFAEHQSRLEPVFNGDVILVELQTKRVFCMHHAGSVFHISAPPGA